MSIHRGLAAVIRDVAERPDRQGFPAAVAVGLLLFGYGSVVIGFTFRVGGVSGLQLVIALQAASVPVLFASAWATTSRRPALAPVFAAAVVAGIATRVALTVAPGDGLGEAVSAALVVVASVAAFALSWAVLGYAGGTALHWTRRGERIARLEVLRSCSLVLAGTVISAVFYGVSWTFLVVGLGDQIA